MPSYPSHRKSSSIDCYLCADVEVAVVNRDFYSRGVYLQLDVTESRSTKSKTVLPVPTILDQIGTRAKGGGEAADRSPTVAVRARRPAEPAGFQRPTVSPIKQGNSLRDSMLKCKCL